MLRGVAGLRKAKRIEGDLISHKSKLSADARLIVALMKKQPQKKDELCRRAGVHLSTFYRLRPILEKKEVIRETEEGYVLWDYNEKEKVVIDVVNRWKSLGFRYPTVEEIADETGLAPEEAKFLVHKTKKETGWFMPNEGIIESARERLGEVLVCAARIRNLGLPKVREDFSYDEDVEIIKEAKRFLEEHTEMLPKLTEDPEDIPSMPSEALKYLGKNHKPKDRSRPNLRAAHY